MEDVTIIYCTCDAYEALWHNFFTLFKRYWPEYNGKIILNTESKCLQIDGLDISGPVGCAREVSWGDRLKMAMDKVDTTFTLVFLDDYYLKGPVDHARFSDTLAYMRNHNQVIGITYLKEPGGYRQSELEGFDVRRHFSLYKITGHISLYRTAYLKRLFRTNETAWQFEVNGTVRSWFTKGTFLCKSADAEPVFPYDWGTLITRGKFYTPVKKYFEQNEGCLFDSSVDSIDVMPDGDEGNILKQLKYLFNGLISIFKRRPK